MKSQKETDVEYAEATAELSRREKAQAAREETAARKDAVKNLAKQDRWLARFNEANELIVDQGADDATGAYNFPVPTGIPQSWRKPIGWNIHYGWDVLPKKFVAAKYDDRREKRTLTPHQEKDYWLIKGCVSNAPDSREDLFVSAKRFDNPYGAYGTPEWLEAEEKDGSGKSSTRNVGNMIG